jgi:two-component system cell cycle sensor histidine kinase/response regulator CckA
MDFQAFFSSNPAASYISTSDGDILACNTSFLKTFGFASVEQAKAHGMASLYSGTKNWMEFVNRLGPVVFLDQELARVDGAKVYVWAHATSVIDEEAHRVQIMGFFLEESQLKVVQERSHQAQRLEAVTRLATRIAYNLDDLLFIASDQLPLLDKGSGMKVAMRMVPQLRRQLNAFSRIQVLKPTPVNLSRMVTRLGAMIRRALPKGTLLRLNLAQNLWATMMNPNLVEEIILNLITNARDAMPTEGQVEFKTENVIVTSERKNGEPVMFEPAPPGEYVLLSVSDNGVGMDRATLERAFEPFFSTRSPGRGLGLSVVYSIINNAEGFIHLESSPDVGTKCRMLLPRTEGMACSKDVVLVVEGEQFLRRQMEHFFLSRGYGALGATSGMDACAVAAEHQGRIDVLVCDLDMPHMDGINLAERLLVLRPGIEIVFLSATESPEKLERVRELRGSLLKKPFLLTTLGSMVAGLLVMPERLSLQGHE